MESSGRSYSIENKCPGRIWYRLYTEDEFWKGLDLGKHESAKMSLPGSCSHLRCMKWEKGDPEVFPTDLTTFKLDAELESKITLSPIFGPRPTRSIKVFLACLAGPADPSTRSDITLIKKFKDAGVPQDNIWVFLERQCTPSSILAALTDAADENICHEGDILFIYLGGNGFKGTGKDYSLATWRGATNSIDVLKAIAKCKAEIFMVVDSGYYGAMIEDALSFFGSDGFKPGLTILTSTQADNSASTGWKLIQMLVDHVGSGKFITPESVGKYVVENLVTSLKTQKAQLKVIKNSIREAKENKSEYKPTEGQNEKTNLLKNANVEKIYSKEFTKMILSKMQSFLNNENIQNGKIGVRSIYASQRQEAFQKGKEFKILLPLPFDDEHVALIQQKLQKLNDDPEIDDNLQVEIEIGFYDQSQEKEGVSAETYKRLRNLIKQGDLKSIIELEGLSNLDITLEHTKQLGLDLKVTQVSRQKLLVSAELTPEAAKILKTNLAESTKNVSKEDIKVELTIIKE